MNFKVMILEDKPDGVGLGCWGRFTIQDDWIGRIKWEHVIKACEAELSGLITDMMREMYGPKERSEHQTSE